MLWTLGVIVITVWALEFVMSYAMGRVRSYPPRGHRDLSLPLSTQGRRVRSVQSAPNYL
jgi:hypothetical protein